MPSISYYWRNLTNSTGTDALNVYWFPSFMTNLFFVLNFMLMAQYVHSKKKQLDYLSKRLKTSKYVCVAYDF